MSSAAKLLIASAASAAFLSACSSVSLAPVEEKSEAQASAPAAPAVRTEPVAVSIPLGGSALQSPGSYTVKRGDTLYRIALNHGVKLSELMSLNGITDPSKLQAGRTLSIPGSRTAPIAAARPAAHEAAAAAPHAAAAPAGPEASHAAAPESKAAEAKPIPGTQETLQWPLHGRSVKHLTAASRGMDIEVDRGTPVKAAAAGEVLLVSSSFKGYGNLVILRHGDGSFVTTYGQLSSISVEKGARVRAGQVIGRSGGLDASKPLLHFEVRISGKPVDPKEYLP